MKKSRIFISSFIALIVVGMLLPEDLSIPVRGASSADWNHNTFWHEPWGSSGVHKGIDIFGEKGTPVTSATYGIVVFSGELKKGGKVVAILGPKWRVHYYAHLQSENATFGEWYSKDEQFGELGDTGNASGKQPHVHYSILSLVPIPWLATFETQGWKKMFYLNPHEKLL